PFPILDDAAASGFARKLILPRQFDPLLSFIIEIGEAKHMSRQLTCWIKPAIFTFKKYTWQVELNHSGCNLWRQMPLQIYKIAPLPIRLPIEAFANFSDIHLDQVCQFL